MPGVRISSCCTMSTAGAIASSYRRFRRCPIRPSGALAIAPSHAPCVSVPRWPSAATLSSGSLFSVFAPRAFARGPIAPLSASRAWLSTHPASLPPSCSHRRRPASSSSLRAAFAVSFSACCSFASASLSFWSRLRCRRLSAHWAHRSASKSHASGPPAAKSGRSGAITR